MRQHQGSHEAFGALMVMILQTVFVLDHLSVEFVDQFIHRGIQVFVRTFGEHVVALHMDIALSTLAAIFFLFVFDAQQHLDIDHLVEMSGDAI